MEMPRVSSSLSFMKHSGNTCNVRHVSRFLSGPKVLYLFSRESKAEGLAKFNGSASNVVRGVFLYVNLVFKS